MQEDDFSNKAEAFEAFDDIPLSPPGDDTIGAVIARRYSRRDMLKGSLGVTAATALFGTAALTAASGRGRGCRRRRSPSASWQAGVDETHHVAEGYEADILIRWGDPLAEDLAPFDPATLTGRRAGQALRLQQRLHRLLPARPAAARAALLCVNHEYANPEVMFPGIDGPPRPQRLRQDHRGARRGRDGGARRQRGRDRPRGRQMARRCRTAGSIAASPPRPR